MNGGKGEVSRGQIILEKPDVLTKKDREDHEAKKRNPKTQIQEPAFPLRYLKVINAVIFNFLQTSRPNLNSLSSRKWPSITTCKIYFPHPANA